RSAAAPARCRHAMGPRRSARWRCLCAAARSRGAGRPPLRNRKADMNTGDDVQLVSFTAGSQEFAFDILQVERILRYEKPAELPRAPDFLDGVVRYEGGAIPVVDLRKR